VQATLEAALAVFDVSTLTQPGTIDVLNAASASAAGAAYHTAWLTTVSTAVDQQYPVETSDCIPRLP